MANQRHNAILEIIDEKQITSQKQLEAELEKRGFKVAQATLSRDIKALGLVKQPFYKTIDKIDESENLNLKAVSKLLRQAFVSSDHAGNITVVHCHAGYAQGVCAGIDGLKIKDIVGTIAGDDTIFILMRTQKDAKMFSLKLEELCK